jgi:hypothetical protein
MSSRVAAVFVTFVSKLPYSSGAKLQAYRQVRARCLERLRNKRPQQ